MPISVASFVRETVEVMVPTSQGDMLVRYRPNAMTPQFERALVESGGDSDQFLPLFCEVVAFIDMEGPLYDETDVDDEGNPAQVLGEGDIVPMEPRFVALLPSRQLRKVLDAIMADMAEDADPKPSAKPSRNGSFSHQR